MYKQNQIFLGFMLLVIMLPLTAMDKRKPLTDSSDVAPSPTLTETFSKIPMLSNSGNEDLFNEANCAETSLDNALETLSSCTPKQAHHALTHVKQYCRTTIAREQLLLQSIQTAAKDHHNILAEKDLTIERLKKQHADEKSINNKWIEASHQEQAEKLQLRRTVAALSITSIGFAGFAAYLYFKKA